MREIEKVLKRFDASLEWLTERIGMREEEIEKIRSDREIEEREKSQLVGAKKMKSIADVLEEVEVLVDTHFFNVFHDTKSSIFLKRVVENQCWIEMRLFKRTWRTLNCTPKTMKIIREIQENLLCVGKMKERIAKKKVGLKCFCSKTGAQLNAKHIISCCWKVSGDINARHDMVVNILLNNIMIKRGLIAQNKSGKTGRWSGQTPMRSPSGLSTGGPKSGRRKGESPVQN